MGGDLSHRGLKVLTSWSSSERFAEGRYGFGDLVLKELVQRVVSEQPADELCHDVSANDSVAKIIDSEELPGSFLGSRIIPKKVHEITEYSRLPKVKESYD